MRAWENAFLATERVSLHDFRSLEFFANSLRVVNQDTMTGELQMYTRILLSYINIPKYDKKYVEYGSTLAVYIKRAFSAPFLVRNFDRVDASVLWIHVQ